MRKPAPGPAVAPLPGWVLRYLVLAVALGLTLGLTGLVLGNLPPGLRLEDAGLAGILVVFLLFTARAAWETFHQCRRQGLWTGAVLLAIASLALPGLAMLQDAFEEPEARGAWSIAPLTLSLLVVAGLWAVAVLGAVPAMRERQRRGGR